MIYWIIYYDLYKYPYLISGELYILLHPSDTYLDSCLIETDLRLGPWINNTYIIVYLQINMLLTMSWILLI